MPVMGRCQVTGLRHATPAAMASKLAAMEFDGLPDGVRKADLMRAIERGGSRCGLARSHIRRLTYLVGRTMDLDWTDERSFPVVWVSVERMAYELGVDRRRVNQVERELAEAGWIAHRDAGNRHRKGARCSVTGCVIWAYGVDLRPLGRRYGELAAAADRHDLEWRSRRIARDECSAARSEIRRLLASLGRSGEYQEIAGGRLREGTSLDDLVAEAARLVGIRDALTREFMTVHGDDVVDHWHGEDRCEDDRPVENGNAGEPELPPIATNTSPPREQNFPSIPLQREPEVTEVCNRPPVERPLPPPRPAATEDDGSDGDEAPGRGSDRGGGAKDHGLCHLMPGQVVDAGSARLRQLAGTDPGWKAVVAAASVRRHELGIHDAAWRDARRCLGLIGAAVLVVVIDGRCAERSRYVWNPSGFVRGCVRRGHNGTLHLHKSVWGLGVRRRYREAVETRPEWLAAGEVP